MKKLLILLLSMVYTLSYAQENKPLLCGTDMGISKWLADFQAGKIAQVRSANDWIIVPVQVHITGEDDGTGYAPTSSIGSTFHLMNEQYEESKIQFYMIKKYNYIKNSTIHNHTVDDNIGSLVDLYDNANALNVFITKNPGDGVCGYYSPSYDVVFVRSNCLNDETLSHEMGHYLSLPHPFNGWEGIEYNAANPTPTSIGGVPVERVDGSNCQNAGDGFCDTPPDYLSERWNCNTDGESTVQYDPDEEPFRSQGKYIMSYSLDGCGAEFSNEQIDAKRANLTDQRGNIIDDEREYIPLPVCDDIVQLFPMTNDSVQYDQATFRWAAREYVEEYRLEVATDFTFNNVVVDVRVADTVYTDTTLERDRSYYWRIGGTAAHSPCERTSNWMVVRSHDFSAIHQIDHDKQLRTWISDGYIHVRAENFEMTDTEVTILDMTGRTVLSEVISGPTSTVRWATPMDNQGIYLLRLRSEDYHIVSKLLY